MEAKTKKQNPGETLGFLLKGEASHQRRASRPLQEVFDPGISILKHGKNLDYVLFVYGTLKRGFPNHKLLTKSIFCGQAKTTERFSMYCRRIPFVVRQPQIARVVGECYLVNPQTLAQIDELEGHPNFYRRELTDVLLNGSIKVSAWMYFFPSPCGKLEKTGEFTMDHMLL